MCTRGLVLLTLLVAGCAHIATVPETVPDDRTPLDKAPEFKPVYKRADGFHQQIPASLWRSMDLSRHVRAIACQPKQALNVNAMDEVDDSAWFTNRNARTPMTAAQVAQGPNHSTRAPSTTGTWRIFRGKRQGVTPGFRIKDDQDRVYAIKLDIPGYAKLNSGAEIISTRLLYAAGYNVPENYLVTFNKNDLVRDPDAKYTDRFGVKRCMTQADFDTLVSKIPADANGRFRAVASKWLHGAIGPFRYEGYRDDDSNDLIPHEHRRELRGLKVVAAWLNHYDTKSNNSLDVYEQYVRHYLIDFGSTLGSQGDEPMPRWIGHENTFDPAQMLTNLLTLGIGRRPFEHSAWQPTAAVGHFESEQFDPASFDAITPNPAFENATNRDGFWGAKIVMSFTTPQIQAAVAEARFDPADAAYVTQVLNERREKIGRYWFGQVNPLDRFEIQNRKLSFDDLAVTHGLEHADRTEYRYRYHVLSRPGRAWSDIARGQPRSIDLDGMLPGKTYCLEIQTRRTGGVWSKQVRLKIAAETPMTIAAVDRRE